MSPEKAGKREQVVYSVAIAVASAFMIWAGLGIGRVHWEASASHEERCRKWRREFFTQCLAVEPRYHCEVQWAQLGGKIFDAPPDAAWADQVDCSEVK